MVTDMEKGSSYGFAVKAGQNPELIKMFNTGLANLKANGEYQKILDTYIKK
jgi:polar amino acid transport system substrate-binding protein